MDKLTRQEIYKDYLVKQGYRPETDSDGDIIFKREGRSYVIIIDEKDEEFFRLTLPNIWPIENEEERIKVLKGCDYSNYRTKVAKAFVVENDVWVTAELLFSNVRDFESVFERLCRIILQATNNFKKGIEEADKKKTI